MLILTRRIGESVMIGSEITVAIVDIKGGQVRVGVKAPREVAVHREDIFKRIAQEHSDSSPRQNNPSNDRPALSQG
jgi:carbon storage regulator